MTYQEFKNDYLNLCKKFGRDTKQKIKNDLKNDVKELEYRIESIKPRLAVKVCVYLYGELHTKRDLLRYERELQFTNQLITEL
jgi:hypothetical protein